MAWKIPGRNPGLSGMRGNTVTGDNERSINQMVDGQQQQPRRRHGVTCIRIDRSLVAN